MLLQPLVPQSIGDLTWLVAIELSFFALDRRKNVHESSAGKSLPFCQDYHYRFSPVIFPSSPYGGVLSRNLYSKTT